MLTEEIRLQIFGSGDLPDLRVDLLSDRNSVDSRENPFETLGTAEKTCLICTWTPVKTCRNGNFGNHFTSNLLRLWKMTTRRDLTAFMSYGGMSYNMVSFIGLFCKRDL